MPSGVVTLGQIAPHLPRLEVGCNPCDRRGRLYADRLIAEHGQDIPIPALLRIIAADCPRMVEGRMHDVCGVHFPGLSTVRW